MDEDFELLVGADPFTLVSTTIGSVALFERLAAEPSTPELDLVLAMRLGTGGMSYYSSEPGPGPRLAAAFLGMPRTELSVQVAASHLAHLGDESKDFSFAARFLVEHPACTLNAALAAVWSLCLDNQWFEQQVPASVTGAVGILSQRFPALPVARLAAAEAVKRMGDQAGRRLTVARFVRYGANMLEPLDAEAAEVVVKLWPEWADSFDDLLDAATRF